MTNEYRIAKERIAVVVHTMRGEAIVGDLFVQAHARHRTGPEDAPDVMNDDEPFFPLAVEGGPTLLVAKDRVRLLEVEERGAGDDAADAVPGARLTPIELTLDDGSTVEGSIYLEQTFGRPRLLDFLNRARSRFLTLYAGDGVRLVNRRLIERVRPLE